VTAGPAAAAPAPEAGHRSERPEIVRLENVTRVYQVGASEVRALDGVTLHIHAGDFVALMGPSGSGKSTLLNVIGCLDRPTSGAYFLEGEPVQALSEDRLAEVRRRTMAFIFQAYHLVPRMTAIRNVELPLILSGVEPSERRGRARAALESVGLAGRFEHRPDQLSGGERQRVAIARAMVTRPRVLLADEPTGNLDSRTGAEIVAVLEKLNEGGLTIALVTHDPGVASHARRLLRMRDGRLLSDAPPPEAPPGGEPGRSRSPSSPAP
jgi:putative ABC transport system ATP-binding protein